MELNEMSKEELVEQLEFIRKNSKKSSIRIPRFSHISVIEHPWCKHDDIVYIRVCGNSEYNDHILPVKKSVADFLFLDINDIETFESIEANTISKTNGYLSKSYKVEVLNEWKSPWTYETFNRGAIYTVIEKGKNGFLGVRKEFRESGIDYIHESNVKRI